MRRLRLEQGRERERLPGEKQQNDAEADEEQRNTISHSSPSAMQI